MEVLRLRPGSCSARSEKQEGRRLDESGACRPRFPKADQSQSQIAGTFDHADQHQHLRASDEHVLHFLQTEGIFTNRFVLEPLHEETGDRREFFRDDEILRLQNYRPKSFNQTRAWTIAMCMLDTGVRIDEVTLVLDDVDMHSEVITILGKGNKRRVVPMSTMFRQLLFRYTQKTAPGFTYVFGTSRGTKTSQRNALRDIGVVERKAGIRELSWHSFRHTFATGFLGGISPISCNEFWATQI